MKKIMIIGCCGSGKTTLAKKLSNKLNLPLIHLDKLNWRDNWQNISKEEFDDLLWAEVIKPTWIIDGNYERTIPLRLKYCDTVIYMDYSRISCLYGVIKRVVMGYGKSRPDMGGYCPERFDFDFIKFVWNFNKNNRKRYYDILSSKEDIQVIILRNRRQAAHFLQGL
ncbi:MAG: topology modulation protein [Niameybacter sp.]|jgi:adenylate kinase family enzyme|nr:topology modulation protein [Niameybacter sp.]MBS5316778.1 topology modulation protein [Clostridiales bacterium]